MKYSFCSFLFPCEMASSITIRIRVVAVDAWHHVGREEASPSVEFGRVHCEESQDVFWGLVQAGEDVDRLGREVPALAGALVGAHAPAGVQDRLARVVLVQKDQVAPREVQEG